MLISEHHNFSMVVFGICGISRGLDDITRDVLKYNESSSGLKLLQDYINFCGNW